MFQWREILADLAPKARTVYVESFVQTADSALAGARINTSLRLEHFLAQVLHESGALTRLEEGLSYSSAERLHAVFPKYFPSLESARPYVHNPQALANYVYGQRMGNVVVGDGYKFRGRGPLQITGRAMYAQIGALLSLPLEEQPELVCTAEHALDCACAVWTIKKCNADADLDDILAVTKRINGGLNGIDDRKAWLLRVRAELGVA
jgi:putative chitinase